MISLSLSHTLLCTRLLTVTFHTTLYCTSCNMHTRHYLLFNNWRNNLGKGHITLSFRAIWISTSWIHFRCLYHSIHSGHTFWYCSQLSPYYRMLFISIIKFCYYISLQNLLLICLVDSVQFLGHPKPHILNPSKYFIINGLLLHIQSSGILIIYQQTEFCIPWQIQSMLHTQRANYCKLHEEIMHITYQLLPTVTIVMLVIKAVINIYRCLCKMPAILARC